VDPHAVRTVPYILLNNEPECDIDQRLDEMIRTKLTLWQPSEDILGALTAGNGDSISSDSVRLSSTNIKSITPNISLSFGQRDILIKREHTVFTSFARAQHISNSNYRQQSTLLSSNSEAINTAVAHSYHIFSVDYENEPALVVLMGTYSRGGPGGIGAVVEKPSGRMGGPGAVCSADWFDSTLLEKKKFEQQIGKFLDDHLMVRSYSFERWRGLIIILQKVGKELAQIIDDQFAHKFKF
jgi:hypothetical protein